MGKLIDLTGQRFGQLIVQKQIGKTKFNHILWSCLCDCGKIKKVTGLCLKNGNTKSCGCNWRKSAGLAIRKDKGLAGFNALFSKYQRSAKRREYQFNLTKEEFKSLTSMNCYYCGKPPLKVSHGKTKRASNEALNHASYLYNGIDRLINDEGYVLSNVVSCCTECNFLKGRLNHIEFLGLVRNISENLWQE